MFLLLRFAVTASSGNRKNCYFSRFYYLSLELCHLCYIQGVTLKPVIPGSIIMINLSLQHQTLRKLSFSKAPLYYQFKICQMVKSPPCKLCYITYVHKDILCVLNINDMFLIYVFWKFEFFCDDLDIVKANFLCINWSQI